MKALAIRQPWPWAIFSAPSPWRKDVENRTWATTLRGRIAVHASVRPSDRRWNDEWDAYCATVLRFPLSFCDDLAELIPGADELTFGALIGTVEIVDCVRQWPSPWFHGPYGFVLREPRLFKHPVPFTGARGFFDVPDGMLPHA